MRVEVLEVIKQTNPWLVDERDSFLAVDHYYPRLQSELLLNEEWDNLCTLLIGPRQ